MAEEAGRSAPDRFQLRWTLARKLGGLAALLVLLLIINAVYNYRALGNIGSELAEVANADFPVTKLITQLNINSLEEHIAFERVLRLATAANEETRLERDRAAADFENLARQFDAKVEDTNRAVAQAAQITTEDQKFGDEVRQLVKEHQDFVNAAHQGIAFAAAGKSAELDRVAG